MAPPIEKFTGKRCKLGQSLLAGGSDTEIIIFSNETPDFTAGVVKFFVGEIEEWVSFTGITDNGGNKYTLTGCIRGLDKDATDYNDNTADNAKDFPAGTPGIFVLHSVDINNFLQKDADETITGDWNFEGKVSFTSTTKAGLRLQNVTTAQRTALTDLSNGIIVFDTDIGVPYIYAGNTWLPLSTGSVPASATESVAGIARAGTVTDQQNATNTAFVQTRYLVETSTGSSEQYRIVRLKSDGTFDSSVLPEGVEKFGGDGSDGDISGALTITGSNDTYIVKNYDSFAPGNNTVTVTPTGCIVHIKVKGDADLTDTTFNFAGKGTAGGVGGAESATDASPGVSGTDVATTIIGTIESGDGGGGANRTGTSSGAGGVGGTVSPAISGLYIQGSRATFVSPGAGGAGGGGGNHSNAGIGGEGGTGGAGGGCVILEVAGDLTFSSSVVNINGVVGADGADGDQDGDPTADVGGGGGAGGGGGGTFVCLYNGTLTGSVTPNVSGGNGGNGGTGNDSGVGNAWSGGGGGGGASRMEDGQAGTTDPTVNGGDGGDGGDGFSVIEKNVVFT